jgi:hypothetical protein
MPRGLAREINLGGAISTSPQKIISDRSVDLDPLVKNPTCTTRPLNREGNMPRFVMGKRRQKRTTMVAPVKMWIAGKSGAQESHLAHTLDISAHGVRLAGFQCELKPEALIEVQYRHKRARFRVLWIITAAGSREKRLGAECLEPQKDIWGAELPNVIDEYEEKD